MKDEILKSYLQAYVKTVSSESKNGFYECPLCGSGTGKNKTGAFSIMKDGQHWKCFSCGESGDIFSLVGKIEGIESFPEQKERIKSIFNAYDNEEIQRAAQAREKEKRDMKDEKAEDYTAFFDEANKHIMETDYHRGISLGTLNRFNVGYVAEWKHPKSDGKHKAPALIIPTSKESYIARSAKPGYDGKFKVGKVHIFNSEILKNPPYQPIFITEGEIDALSIIDAGGQAIAMGSAANVDLLLAEIKNANPGHAFILALDNDETGKETAEKLVEQFQKLQILFFISPLFNGANVDEAGNIQAEYKDPNEALNKDREGLAYEIVEQGESQMLINDAKAAAEALEKEAYKKNSAKHHIADFINEIRDSINTPCIPTGFPRLDEALDGGLYEGLYIVGAISSLGKTTFVLQMADQIAKRGQDVLIFSLEMARSELMAKSISRLTALLATHEKYYKEHGGIKNAKTTRGITVYKRYEEYNETEKNLINDAIRQYEPIAEHIYIVEGMGNIGVQQIREAIDKHILFTGRKPVVIVDYLQILAPYSERASDKQNTDKAVLELKRISRDNKLPLIAVSSFNRESYKEAVSMKAFKESGAIEYSCDVLLGMQLEGAGSGEKYDERKEKKANPRRVEVVILKNRNGETGTEIPMNYYTLFNQIQEAPRAEGE